MRGYWMPLPGGAREKERCLPWMCKVATRRKVGMLLFLMSSAIVVLSFISITSKGKSMSNEPGGLDVVYSEDNVTIHPTQHASGRINGRLQIIKQGSILFSPEPARIKGRTKKGERIATEHQKPELFELSNGIITARITNVGATIISLLVPDAHGKLGDVVLGFDSIDSYLKDNAPYFGCIVGRVANRIKDGKFTLDGVEYTLPIDNPPNSLHGGNKGFDKVIWEVAEYIEGQSITFKYHSKDGEEGYPGDVIVSATYSLPSSMSLKLYMEAVPMNKPTPINLAQHTYWNLAGHNSGDVLGHSVQIWASRITPVDGNLIPTGEMLPVSGTPFDFTTENRIGSRISEVPGGYDHNYVLDYGEERSGLKHAAEVKDPSTSRILNLWTDAPGVQFYTANYVNGIVGKGGAVYEKHAGLCLETQGFPNAVNQPNFPSIVVQPRKKYMHTMLFEFSIKRPVLRPSKFLV